MIAWLTKIELQDMLEEVDKEHCSVKAWFTWYPGNKGTGGEGHTLRTPEIQQVLIKGLTDRIAELQAIIGDKVDDEMREHYWQL